MGADCKIFTEVSRDIEQKAAETWHQHDARTDDYRAKGGYVL